jgi:uncharacterized protein YjbI with pentapeptide repeats
MRSPRAEQAATEFFDESEKWARCTEEGCTAARLGDSRCLAHADQGEMADAVERWRAGEVLDARGVTVGADALERLLEHLEQAVILRPPDTERRLRPSSCGAIHFQGARFETHANFRELSFPGAVLFDHAVFQRGADFGESVFAEHADFDHASFDGRVNFRGVRFEDHAGFEGTGFMAQAVFTAAQFAGYVDLKEAVFKGDALLDGARFETARQLGPFTVAGVLDLDASEFAVRTALEVRAETVRADAVVFADGARLTMHGGRISLLGADLGRASMLAGVERNEPPVLVTLSGAQVAGTSLSGIDLRECRFHGAHGLERLNVDAGCVWLATPDEGWCVEREMLIEEDEWRRARERGGGRRLRWCWAVSWSVRPVGASPPEVSPAPGQLAGLYRALRKAREDSNDQAGAGDLYYGEMEMRRLRPFPAARGRARTRARAEKAVLSGYWMVAGYGLKASRSLAFLLASILLAAGLLSLWGFHEARNYGRSVLFAAQSSLTPVHPPEAPMSASGQALQLALRLSGPALLALSILALRSRIKR